MFNFSNAPPPNAVHQKFQLIRTPERGRLKAVVTSDDIVGTPTHFWGGRTVPCGDVQCDACDKGVKSLWHAYLSAYIIEQQRHILFECTAQASEAFVAYRVEHNTLRGCVFEAVRFGRGRNGRVHITCNTAGFSLERLPHAPDLLACLARIWNVPPADCCIQGRTIGVADIHVADPDADKRPPTDPVMRELIRIQRGNGNPAA